MDEPLYFKISRAESWAMESAVRNRLLALDGVEEVRVRLGDGRVTVLGRDLDAAGIVSMARQAGCEIAPDAETDESDAADAWPVVAERGAAGPLTGAWVACLAGLGLTSAEGFGVLPSMNQDGAQAFWLAVAAAILLLGVAMLRACLAGTARYPGKAVLAAAGVLALGGLLGWLYTVVGCLYLSLECGPSYAYLDTALVAFGAAGLVVATGRNGWARVRSPLGEQLPPCPKTVRVLRNGLAQSLELHRLRVGELVHAVMGDTIAADGVVTRGYGTVDESAVNGRSEAQTKAEGDEVLAGSQVRDGDFVYCVNRTGRDTVMASLLAAADGVRGLGGQLAASGRIMAVAVSLGLVTALAWWYADAADVGRALQIGLTMVMFAAPIGFLWNRSRVMAGITAKLSRAGILVRSHQALLEAARLRTVLFDQGLSLTVGNPQVMGVEPASSVRVRDLFVLAASVEADSRHPLAESIISATLERDLPLLPASDFRSWPQEGVSSVVDGRRVLVGNGRLLSRFGIERELEQRCAEMAGDGRAVVHVAVDGRHIGLLAVEDAPAPGAAETVRGLVERGIRSVMITGASRRAAVGFARGLGIEDVRAELSPGRKAEVVEAARSDEGSAAVVVRAGADHSAQSADVAVVLRGSGERVPAGGDVVLFSGLPGLLQLVDEARSARTAVARTRSLCAVYLLLLLPLAAGLSLPLVGWLVPGIAAPIVAAVAVMTMDALGANHTDRNWSMENE